MSDEDETILIPIVGPVDAAAEPAAATGTRRERRMAASRTGGSWPWFFYAVAVGGVVLAASVLAVEGVS